MRNTVLAVNGGDKVVSLTSPRWPVVGKQEERWMGEVVRSGKWSWVGKHEQAFCEEYREFIGTKYCLGLANGTVTLQCALQAVGVVPGDEVLVPAMTWVATAQAAMDIGATVIFVDVDPQTLTIDPDCIRKAITPKTKAIIPVHLYGCMCDMDVIMKIARKHKLKVVEDVAHQHGSRWKNKGAGAIGDAGSFSFQQSKVLTSGEGGAVTTNSAEIYQTIFALKQVGFAPANPRKDRYGVLKPANRYGHNYRMTEMQAVLLRGGLSRLTRQTEVREMRAAQITEALETLDGPLKAAPRDPRITRQAYYAMTLDYDPDKAGGVRRDAFLYALHHEGVEMGCPYAPVYSNPLLNLYDRTSPIPFRDPAVTPDYRNPNFPNTERAVNETAVVLMHQHLLGSKTYINQCMRAVRKVSENLPAVADAWTKHVKATKRKTK